MSLNPLSTVVIRSFSADLFLVHMFKNLHVSICILTSFLTGFMTFVNLYYVGLSQAFFYVCSSD